MATVATLLTEVESRLNDASNSVWTEAELKGYIRFAIKDLFPTYYRRRLEETVASVGPQQAAPAGARNLVMVGHKRQTSSRVRPVRGWIEAEGKAFVAKSGITGDTLVWSWIEGFDPPTSDSELLNIPLESELVVVLQAQKAALERLLSSKAKQDRYLSLNVRESLSETDILDTIDGLRAAIEDIKAKALPRPEVRG